MKYFTKNVFAFLLAMTIIGLNSTTAQFWSYDFGDQAAFDTAWVSGGMNDGSETWVWSDDLTALLFGAQPEFAATTATNGFAIFNSDGNGENPHDVTLTTTNAISTMGVDNVYLRFENQYAFFSSGSVAQVGVSTDGTVFTYYPVLEGVEGNDLASNLQVQILEIPEAANQAEVWIQFRWQGNFEYTWRIDDVGLFDSDPTPSTSFGLGTYLFYSPASFAQPLNQIDTDTIGFFANVVNDGGDDITNVVVRATIQDEAENVLFMDTLHIDVLEAGTTDTVDFEGLFAPDMLDLGLYSVNYNVFSTDIMDPSPADNEFQELFLVTEDLWSKDNATETATRPGGGGDYILANVYTTSDNLLPDTYTFGDVFFNAAVNAADAPLAGRSATIVVAKVLNDVVDGGWNGFDTNQELALNEGLELIGFIPHEFTGENFDLQTVTVTNFDGDLVTLEPSTRYIIGAQYTGDDNVIFQGISNSINYYQISTIIHSSQWFLGGFGPETAASIRVSAPVLVDGTNDTPLPVEAMNVFPNPVDDQLTLNIDLENTGLANIVIADMSGKTMKISEYENLQNGTYTFDVSDYANGIYMARLITADGTRTVKFNVQH